MRCVACYHDSKKKDRKVESVCPSCGHQFALNPEIDGVADGFIEQAVVAVSSKGAHKYLPAQLDYEVWRRSQPPTTKERMLLYLMRLAVLVGGGLILFSMAYSSWDIPIPIYFLTIVLTIASLKGVYAASPASNSRPKNPKSALWQ